ncbi:ROK family protein (putative glucokinase) [Parapedobacter composti]|uniref:ROK family protein (Putative glucokinase) n=1 Tax=Parapedobacter composti TaxID=623281 RepID=A0A1I1KTD5_9SPHI|nr:ROK family protein [Parapedobacter composti]SFC61413.1 ROK family protein (putative glucokinase) [Parapedobacter composti]
MSPLFLSNSHLENKSKIEKKNHGFKLKLVKALIAGNGMTNAAICKHLRISAPKTLELISSLAQVGIIEQNEKGNSIGGRKPVLNKIKPNTFYILCAEVELFRVKMTLVDNTNTFLRSVSIPFTLTQDWSSAIQLVRLLTEFMDDSDVPEKAILAIGISMPGLISYKDGRNHTYMSDEKQLPLREYISNQLGKPAFIVNDVKSAAMAELKFGLAQGRKDVLVILMDWGIGLGIIMDGRVRNGAAGFSGEMGHMPFVEDGILCYCGKKGCLETVASGVALANMAREGILSGQDSLLNTLPEQEIENIAPQIVINAANKGDQYAISILASIGERLGKGIATLIQLFNPELIILGGKIAEANQYITIPIQQAINTYCMTPLRDIARVELSRLGADAGAKGIAHIAFEKYFDMLLSSIEAER